MNRTLLFAALLSFHVAAQDTTDRTLEFPIVIPNNILQETPGKWQIGASFSGDLAYRKLFGDDYMDLIIDMRNNAETMLPAYTTGVNVVYNHSSRLGFEGGVHFSRKGFQSRYTFNDPVIEEVRYLDVYEYLEIPLKVNYTIGKRRLRWTGSAGLINGLLLDAREELRFIHPDGAESHNNHNVKAGFRPYNLSVSLSAGMDWQIVERIHLKAEPTFRYGITKIIDTPVTARLWNLGMTVGLYYGL
jgi:hypothetical protein